MFKLLSRSCLVGLVASAAVLSACAGQDEEEATEAESAATEASTYGPALFRDDFRALLQARSRHSDDDVKKLVYLPTRNVLSPKVEGQPSSAEARLFAYDKAFTGIKPSDLFANGERTPFKDKRVADLEATLRAHPVHIVILPGIFSEFIPRTPFEELFSADTAARRDFAVRGARVKDSRLFVGDVTYDDRARGYVPTRREVPLTGTTPNGEDALVRVASIDDDAGKPLVTVAYLKANLGSLEDFGTLQENSDTYLHRLDKYFEAVGVPENVYIMGYSRGAVAGLDLLARAKGKPWAANVKGFVSHAGVIYGSQLADASFTTGPSTELLNVLRAFIGDKPATVEVAGENVEVRNLASCRDPDIVAGAANKALAWPAFLALAARISARNPKHPEIALEGIDANLPDMGRLSSFAAMALGIPLPGVGAGTSRGVVDLQFWDTNHCKNVASFKATARAILAGAETLTTKSRIQWWKTNVLPSDVRYFALTGTMGDATVGGTPWQLATNDLAFDNGSIDFRSLRGNYYDFLAASQGIQLQDSQVSVERGRFWPELHVPKAGRPVWNPAQKPIKTYFMGTVGTHHWGLSFPRAFSTQDGRDCPAVGVTTDPRESCGNPFPRTVLLETIATFAAQVATGAERRSAE
ncbi:MAG: hypothetical protein JST00_18390 [Deltaproteobacteria bacterium]|nr:hypothetical protein [Deltaproteobacteria bacterium]